MQRGGQKYNCPCHFHWLADTVQRCDPFNVSARNAGSARCALRARCADEGQRHGVHEVIPYLPHSTAKHLVRCAIPALVTQ
jgi:hypothetical protein